MIAEATVPRLLIVDDEPEMRAALTEAVRRMGYGVSVAATGPEAIQRIAAEPFAMVITDVKLPGTSGVEVLKAARSRLPETPVLLMTAYGTIENAVEAMKAGAFDYLLKPFPFETIQGLIRRALGRVSATGSRAKDLVAEDGRMRRVIELARSVASSRATVLLQGESGTGKELLARLIHRESPRRDGPFVAINCAALPEGLLESELFGYEKGAFTGAATRKAGRFEQAHRGTLLLDEVSEMALGLQAKLLRVLQEQEVDRVGGKEPVAVDVRVIATTNRDLRAEVEAGRFRGDLYYRLNVFPITVPPLRERRADIAPLARHFLDRAAALHGRSAVGIDPEALALLKEHPWKGNVRELENLIERAVLVASGPLLTSRDLFPEEWEGEESEVRDQGSGVRDREAGIEDRDSDVASAEPFPVGTSVKDMEKDLILKTLKAVSGNRTHAARLLGISLRTIRNKLREYRNQNEECAPHPSPPRYESIPTSPLRGEGLR